MNGNVFHMFTPEITMFTLFTPDYYRVFTH